MHHVINTSVRVSVNEERWESSFSLNGLSHVRQYRWGSSDWSVGMRVVVVMVVVGWAGLCVEALHRPSYAHTASRAARGAIASRA